MLTALVLIVLGAVSIVLGLVFAIVPGVVEKQKNRVVPHKPWPASERAKAVHETLLIADWHTDSLLWNRDLLKRSDRGHVDVPRMQQGNIGIQVLTAVTKSPRGLNYQSNSADTLDNITLLAVAQLWPPQAWFSLYHRALHQANKLHNLVDRAPDQLAIIRDVKDLQRVLRARESGKKVIGVMLGLEGGHPLQGDINKLDGLFAAGYRLLGVTHFFDNELGGSLHGESNTGLTPFGREVVKKARERGMIIDLAHASPMVAKQVVQMNVGPLVVSHTGVYSHCKTKRNFRDALMKRIAKTGGAIGIGYWKTVVCDPTPKGVVRAISAAIRVVGEDHVSLGSDYDGAVEVSFDVSELASLTHAMLDAGYSERRIRKVMGGNQIRVMRAVLPR